MSGDESTRCEHAEDAAAFALHTLEPEEEARLREHLAGCPSCQATVSDVEVAAAAFATAVDQVEPPARLRENILAQAARTPQVTPGPTREAGGAADPGAVRPDRAGDDRVGARGTTTGPARSASGPGRAAGSGPRRSPGATEPRPRRGASGPGRYRRRRIVAAVLAVVVLIAVAGVGGLVTYTVRLQQQRDAQIAQTQALVEVLTQLDRPGTSHTTLSTSDGRPVAAVVTTPSERMVMTADLPPNDHDSSVYVVWGVSTTDPQPIGTFDVGPAGDGPVVRQLGPAGGEPFLGYAISLEPGRVAPPSPTTVLASGQVQA